VKTILVTVAMLVAVSIAEAQQLCYPSSACGGQDGPISFIGITTANEILGPSLINSNGFQWAPRSAASVADPSAARPLNVGGGAAFIDPAAGPTPEGPDGLALSPMRLADGEYQSHNGHAPTWVTDAWNSFKFGWGTITFHPAHINWAAAWSGKVGRNEETFFDSILSSIRPPTIEGCDVCSVMLASYVPEGEFAGSAANGVRLGQQLAWEEANSAFTASGELSADAVARSAEIIPESELEVVKSGTIPQGFSKFSTRTYQSPYKPFKVHFYMNKMTGEIIYDVDYKVIFNVPR
jgi:hypothetical protein